MAWSTPSARAAGYVVPHTVWNTDVVDNPIALRAGEVAVASQTTGDVITAASATQLGRVAPGASGTVLTSNGVGLAPSFQAAATTSKAIAQGRITLTTGVPVTTSDVTAATTIYFTPFNGNEIVLYSGSAWALLTFSEVSLAVPGTTDTLYDLWAYNNGGAVALEALAWTNDTTRATALATQDGVLVKSGAATRRYLGSFRTTGVNGQTEDSAAKRYIWNYTHRRPRSLRVLESTNSWAYTTATMRQARGSTANQVDVVVGVADALVDLRVGVICVNSAGSDTGQTVAIGEDSTSAMKDILAAITG